MANNIAINNIFTYETVPRFSSIEAEVTHDIEDILKISDIQSNFISIIINLSKYLDKVK